MDFHAPELLVLYAQSWDTATPSIANLVIPCCHGHRRHPWLFSPVAAPHSRSRCTHHGQRAECPSKRQRQAPGPASSHVLESSGVPVSRAGGLLCPAPVCFTPPPPPQKSAASCFLCSGSPAVDLEAQRSEERRVVYGSDRQGEAPSLAVQLFSLGLRWGGQRGPRTAGPARPPLWAQPGAPRAATWEGWALEDFVTQSPDRQATEEARLCSGRGCGVSIRSNPKDADRHSCLRSFMWSLGVGGRVCC